jgi:3-oxoacyl-[acyl-carrier protein] reductase
MSKSERRVALVTGVGRRAGMGTAIATKLAADGYDVAATYWPGLDRTTYGEEVLEEPHAIALDVQSAGARTMFIEADLNDATNVSVIFDRATEALGEVSVLVVNHTYCVPTPLMEVTIEDFDRHLAVNVRSLLLLIQEFARRFRRTSAGGRIITLTSDHTAGNVPYGVSKGAADRLTDAAAYELGHLGISANAINPGPVDTGWMDDEIRQTALAKTPLGRGGTARDTANLVSFLCSDAGRWITGQLLYSNGGFRGTLG